MCEVYANKSGDPFTGSFKKFRPLTKRTKDVEKWRKDLGLIRGLLADISLRLDRNKIFSTFILACYHSLKDTEVKKFIKIIIFQFP